MVRRIIHRTSHVKDSAPTDVVIDVPLHIAPQHMCIFFHVDEMYGAQEAGERINGHTKLGLGVGHGRCEDRRRKEEWMARLYGLPDPGLGGIVVATCDAPHIGIVRTIVHMEEAFVWQCYS